MYIYFILSVEALAVKSPFIKYNKYKRQKISNNGK